MTSTQDPRLPDLCLSEQVGVLGVLVDELGHVPAQRDDGPASGAYVVEGATDQPRAEALVAHRRLALGVREDHDVAVGPVVRKTDETPSRVISYRERVAL
jgi:hypothetical protein